MKQNFIVVHKALFDIKILNFITRQHRANCKDSSRRQSCHTCHFNDRK